LSRSTVNHCEWRKRLTQNLQRVELQEGSSTPAMLPHFPFVTRLNLAVPFLDHINENLDTQFSSIAQKAASLLGLVPAIICKTSVIGIPHNETSRKVK
jgi:hypothetical protein